MCQKERVLFVGLLCADIVSTCNDYPPPEDTKYRCIEQTISRGGNASNSSTVCSLLGGSTEILCSMAKSAFSPFLKADLVKYGISFKHCPEHDGHNSPISCVIINVQNGSRTLLMSPRTLPELSFSDFAKLDLHAEAYSWIHFEGAPNLANIQLMMERIQQHNNAAGSINGRRIGISVEIEKVRPNMDMETLVPYADVTFFSKDYARLQGRHDMHSAVAHFARLCRPGASVVCAWGEEGAAVATVTGNGGDVVVATVPSSPPPRVVDTLGAGDTLVGSTVYALSRGACVVEAVRFGCRVAGVKCGLVGFDGISSLRSEALALFDSMPATTQCCSSNGISCCA